MMTSLEKPVPAILYKVPLGCKPWRALQFCCPHCPHMHAFLMLLHNAAAGHRASPALTKKLSRSTVPRCPLTAWKASAQEDSSVSFPSLPSGRGNGLT